MDRTPHIISFDLCGEARKNHYSYRSGGYEMIRKILEKHGFGKLQFSLYINWDATEQEAQAAVDELRTLPWFPASATRLHMFPVRKSDLWDRSEDHAGCLCKTKPRKPRGRPPAGKTEAS